MKLLILLLSCFCLFVPVLSLRCWVGTNDQVNTVDAGFGKICLKYHNCKTGWSNDLCSVTPTWEYITYSASNWQSVFTNYYNQNLTACYTDYCNSLVDKISLCYIGTEEPPQMASSNGQYCYYYKENYKNVYGKTASCSTVSGQNLKCCKGNLCNNVDLLSSDSVFSGIDLWLYLLCLILLLS